MDKSLLAYDGLRELENELIESLEGADLVSLARQAANCKLIFTKVLTNVESLHPTVPYPLVCRYLFYNAYKGIHGKDRSEQFNKWLGIIHSILKERKPTSGVLAKISNLATLSDQDGVLKEMDVPRLTEALVFCSYKWKEIAISLGRPIAEIESLVQRMHIHSNTELLARVISAWIKSEASCPTLKKLETALRSETVGLGQEANKLQKKILASAFPSGDSASKLGPIKLHENEIISQTQNLAISEGSSVLLEVQVSSCAVTSGVTFQWLKDGVTEFSSDHQLSHSYSEFHHVGILVLHVDSLLAEGAYSCKVSYDRLTVESDPIMLTVTTPIDQFQQPLVELYTEQPEVPEDTWPPTPSSNTYISLALIKQSSIHNSGEYGRITIRGDADDIYNDKESLLYEKAFGDIKHGTRLLVEGRPGSGKTTLMHKVTQDWAKAVLKFEHVRLLIFIHVRAFCSDSKVRLPDLLQCCFQSQSSVDQLARYAEKRNGLGFCFILDGLDEYVPTNVSTTYIYKLITKNYLPKAIVIVASRPAAAFKLRAKVSRQVEVLGFLKDQIADYVDSYPFSEPTYKLQLNKYLQEHTNVYHMCYLPVHVSIVCFLFNELNASLPHTETEIYKEFTKFTILRILFRNDEFEGLESVEDLPKDKRDWYLKVCRLAYKMCTLSKQVATQKEISIFSSPGSSKYMSLGLITVDKIAFRSGFQSMYTFLHLTFQEFLAAYHVASLAENEQLKVIIEFNSAKQMQQVWKFYCGLTQFDANCRKFKAIIDNTEYGSLFSVQCGYESQQPHVCDHIIKDNCMTFENMFMSLSDFTQISFILSSTTSNPVVRLSFDRCILEQQGIDKLAKEAGEKLSLLTSFRFRSGSSVKLGLLLRCLQSVETLDLSYSIFLNEGLKSLPTEGLCQVLHTLKLSCDEDSYSALPFSDITARISEVKISYLLKSFSSLEKLDIPYSTFVNVGIHSLLTKNLKALRVLKLSLNEGSSVELPEELRDDFTSKGNRSFNIYLSRSSDSDIEELPCLHSGKVELNLSTVKLRETDLRSLSINLVSDPLFSRIALDGCGIDDEGASLLAAGLKYCKVLERLMLAFNNVSDSGAMSIANGVKHSSSFSLLNLTHNKISDKGGLDLASIFKHPSDLPTPPPLPLQPNESHPALDEDNQIQIPPPIQLRNFVKVLLSLNKITRIDEIQQVHAGVIFDTIDISNRSLRNLGADWLASLLPISSLHSEILRVDFSKNCYSHQSIRHICSFIAQSTNLITIDLSSNAIGADGATCLSTVLEKCIKLEHIDLSSNGIGPKGSRAIARALKYGCTDLCELKLNFNGIKSSGTTAIVDALTHCKNLKKLYIGSNGIESKGVRYLAHAFSQQYWLQFSALDISSNGIGIEGAIALANSLTSCATLEELYISDNAIQSKGALSLAGVLKNLTKFKALDISCNSIQSSGAVAIAGALEHCSSLHALNVRENSIEIDGIQALFSALEHWHAISDFDISHNNVNFYASILHGQTLCVRIKQCLSSLHNFDVINSTCRFDRHTIRNLERSNIQKLGIGNISMFTSLVDNPENYKELRVLDISFNSCRYSPKFTATIKHFKHLEALNVSNNEIEDQELATIVHALEDHLNLHVLNISGNSVGNATIMALTAIAPTLSELNVSGINYATSSIEHCLRLCINLQKLFISSSSIRFTGAKSLAKALKYCIKIRTLDVSNNPFMTQGFIALVGVLKHFPHLSELNLANCQLKMQNRDDCSPLKSLLSLQCLNISQTLIGDCGARSLAEALRKNTRLLILRIQNSNVSTDGVMALTSALEHCSIYAMPDKTSSTKPLKAAQLSVRECILKHHKKRQENYHELQLMY